MYTVNDMPPSIPSELLGELLATDTGTLGHFLDSGFMDAGIQGRMPGAKIAGTAITVQVPFPDSVAAHYALKLIRPGDVLVVARGADRGVACWGGTTSVAAAAAKLTGLIMDSAGNDISQANRAGLPIWCRDPTPLTTKYRNLGGAINVPVSCGGVAVMPGDAILADENGVAVIPAHRLAAIVAEAKLWHAKEAQFFAALAADPNACYPDLTGASAMVEKSLARGLPRDA